MDYRIYTETTTGGMVREVCGKKDGTTGDVYVIEYSQNPIYTMTYGTLTKLELLNR